MGTLEVPLLSRSPTLPPGLTDLHRSQGQLHFESHEDKLHSHNNALLHARPGTASSTNYILCFNFCKLPVLVSISFLRKRRGLRAIISAVNPMFLVQVSQSYG